MSKKSSKRPQLSAKDASLWNQVAENLDQVYGAKARNKLAKPVQAKTPPKTDKARTPSAPAPLLTPDMAERLFTGTPAKANQKPVPRPMVPIEKQVRRGLKRGKVGVDRQLDLHGLTQAQAHDRLVSFIAGAYRDGVKLVLVITGKGGNKDLRQASESSGVLRQLFPKWMAERQIRDFIIGFEPAHIHHGGAGAFYVRIKNATKLKSVKR